MTTLTAARLRELLHYDPETGIFTRRIGLPGVRAGARIGSLHLGYLRARVDGRDYLLHRLAFLYMTGEMPKAEVDHINCDRADNRWANLRPATRVENARNRKRATPGGLKGVQSMGRWGWRADIGVDGETKFLGLFQTPKAAHAAYCAAAKTFHGEFANFGTNSEPAK